MEVNPAEVEAQLKCPLCHRTFRTPCTGVDCTHTFCRTCIEQYMVNNMQKRSQLTCPVSGCTATLGFTGIKFNRALTKLMIKLLAAGILSDVSSDDLIVEFESSWLVTEAEADIRYTAEEKEEDLKVEKRKRSTHDQVVPAAGHEEEDRQDYAQEMNGEAEGGSDDPSPPRSNSKRAKAKIRDRTMEQEQTDDEEPIYQNFTANSSSEVRYCPVKGNDIEFAVLPGSPDLPKILNPYLKSPLAFNCRGLLEYVERQLEEFSTARRMLNHSKVCLYCASYPVEPSWTVHQLYEQQWMPRMKGDIPGPTLKLEYHHAYMIVHYILVDRNR